MIVEGTRLMLVGMTTVFAFLALMVVLMALSGRLLRGFAEREEAEREASAATDDAQEIAVVLAAIEAHRRSQRSS